MKPFYAKLISPVMILIFSFFLIAPIAANATAQADCSEGARKSREEVGRFMGGNNDSMGVCNECYNDGACGLWDAQRVFANVGNFILEIAASLVLLMYVIGGIFMISSGGRQAWVAKGKKFITISTVGLLIIVFGYAGLTSIKSALTSGSFSSTYSICEPDTANETSCGQQMECWNGVCVSFCEKSHGSDGFSCVADVVVNGVAQQCHCLSISSDGSGCADPTGMVGGMCPTGNTCCKP